MSNIDSGEKFSHSRWRGRMRTCNGVGSGGLSPSEVLRFDDALSRLLSRKYPRSHGGRASRVVCSCKAAIMKSLGASAHCLESRSSIVVEDND
jgi:hypothetical protein